MALADLTSWMDENSRPETIWFIKRLAANDTLASGAHQAGPYIPKEILFEVFPSISVKEKKNPDTGVPLYIDSHGDVSAARAVWYNNKFHGVKRGRNEARLTGLGGTKSALLDPDSTGSIAVFAFNKNLRNCRVWVCDPKVEEDLVEDRIGPVEPGRPKMLRFDEETLFKSIVQTKASCWLEEADMPAAWLTNFPTGHEILRKTVELRPEHGIPVDVRLLKRRACEFEIFQSVEAAVELTNIRRGFQSVDDFVARAQTILQRRKARSGRSLELHTRQIFLEEKLTEGADFQHQAESETGKRPDFLFPSQAAYQNPAFPTDKLRMLAVKTTCKDRWRQILNEADRIQIKHLLTLQEGVSLGQFREMADQKVQLVVPQSLIETYPAEVRPHLQNLESFIGDIRLLTI